MPRIHLKPLRLLSWGVGFTTLLVAMLAAATLWLGAGERAYVQSVRRTLAAQNQIDEVLSLVQHVETSQRGYLYTGRALYLDDYKASLAALPAVMDKTAALVAFNPRQQERIGRLRRFVAGKADELQTTINEQSAGRGEAARAIVNSDRGLQLMDEIHQLLSEMGNEEARFLSVRQSTLDTLRTLLDVGAGAAFLMICALGVLVTVFTRRSFAELTNARDELAVVNLQLTEEARQRQQTNTRLQLAMDAAQLGSWQYDSIRRVISGDTRCQEILGLAKQEAPVEDIAKLVCPDDAERVWATSKAALDPADPKGTATEFRLRQENGEVRWVETLGLGHFEGTGCERRAVRMVGTLKDITERKEREEREHLLMREISHRAKNMLSVVHAIAQQTSTRNPEDFVQRFCERIQALAANQDLLIRNDWKGVEIGDLVHAQLAPFSELLGSRIVVCDLKLQLKAASAQAIGLALHELATNAGKYGALSTGSGRVDIAWGNDGGTFAMSWIETGGPPVSPPQASGFGTLVMAAMAERSVCGTVELEYPLSGVNWRLTCPAMNALEGPRT